ncbi:radical SAM family heme chaperone HemW [Sphingobacterium daejeonense]|uniref:radical SAM family heme chaperone HemW n=1 Tax=Sphingobacterium daejeonense TaxID=371142 RepID=UPI0021A360DB|nr:radical SAM family heme chaperone HemW [Sphingobacterium daejeonense]MCT1531670.1 radical SAM family heme chaperone HemW [Sphingobacterium daejeonense]
MFYFHIPFCKQSCHYCDFHFSTSLKYKEELLDAMLKEIELRASYLEDNKVESLYFGGGTPSILEAKEIDQLIGQVAKYFEISSGAEITLEANPDDLDKKKVQDLRNTEINRFSIGIQSFYEEDLIWMNRAHNSEEARSSIMRVQDAGFENITCDLIYGFPLLTNTKWKGNMQQLIDLDVPHISSYSMTVEKKTALAHMINKGNTPTLNEEQSAEQMLMLIDTLTSSGYEHYEISNFAKPDRYARHNSNYWKGKSYLGIGPSAHSFNGNSRSWNIANNALYIKGILAKELPLETEQLSKNHRFNEYVMTSLRTKWGIDKKYVEREFGSDFLNSLLKNIEEYVYNKDVNISDQGIITLTPTGKLLADQIASELFIVE